MTPLVEREINLFDGRKKKRGFVRMFRPEREGDRVLCRFQVTWPGYDETRTIFGVDEWQALQLALQIAPSVISGSPDFQNGRIGLWGEKVRTHEQLCKLFGVKPIEGPATK